MARAGLAMTALAKSEARLRRLVARSSAGIAVISFNGTILFANPSATRLIGRPHEKLNGAMFGYPFASRRRVELSVGADRIVEVHLVETEWEGEPAWLASLFDITAHKRSQADLEGMTVRLRGYNRRLERLARIDPLTEILNRRGLEAELWVELRHRLRTGAPLSALLLDCDDFKRINETLGHAAGDFVLKMLASRVARSLRPSDHIGRIGGDEFMVLLPGTPLAEACQVAERLRLAAFDRPLRSSSGSVQVSVSIGIAMISGEALSIEDVLALTQAAMQHSKHCGKNRVSTSDGAASVGSSDSEVLERALQGGAALSVVYEKIVCLADGSVVGQEMLTRGPSGVFERPRDFCRVAFERNILTEVDLYCLKACIRAAPDLPRPLRRHVNLFPSTLLDVPAKRIIELFPPLSAGRRFCVEISEQQMTGEPSLLRNRIRALQEAGLSVAIDDVGFGQSSLETLMLLEPDMVKIDRSFVHGASRDTGRERSLRRMVDVVASTESEVVAEGVESHEDIELLLEMGVALGQGGLWGDPALCPVPQARC